MNGPSSQAPAAWPTVRRRTADQSRRDCCDPSNRIIAFRIRIGRAKRDAGPTWASHASRGRAGRKQEAHSCGPTTPRDERSRGALRDGGDERPAAPAQPAPGVVLFTPEYARSWVRPVRDAFRRIRESKAVRRSLVTCGGREAAREAAAVSVPVGEPPAAAGTPGGAVTATRAGVRRGAVAATDAPLRARRHRSLPRAIAAPPPRGAPARSPAPPAGTPPSTAAPA